MFCNCFLYGAAKFESLRQVLLEKLSASHPVALFSMCSFQQNRNLWVQLVFLTQSIFKVCHIKTHGMHARGILLVLLFLIFIYDIIAVTSDNFMMAISEAGNPIIYLKWLA